MNVYDFDNTLYDGESSFDFFIFCMKRDKYFLKRLPLIIRKLIKYKLCLVSNEELFKFAEMYAKEFFEHFPNYTDTVNEFWDTHIHKIKPFYKPLHREDDAVVSASPDFLLREGLGRIGVKNYICTELEPVTGKVIRLCFRKDKVKLFREKYGDEKIENFYTDSMNDKPLMEISERSFLVKGNEIKEL